MAKEIIKNAETMTAEAQEAIQEQLNFDGAEVVGTTAQGAEVLNPPAKKEEAGKDAQALAENIKKEFAKRETDIAKSIGNIEKSFLTIAFNLHWIRENQCYKLTGHKNVYEYAEEKYGFKKTTCHNMIAIIENFAMRSEHDGRIIEKIDECYKNFKMSQLVAMIGISEENRKGITADTPVRKIDEIRKAQDKGADAEEKEVDTSAKPKPALVNTLITLETYHDYQTKLEAIDDLIMRAFKSSRHPVKIKVIMEEDLNNERE